MFKILQKSLAVLGAAIFIFTASAAVLPISACSKGGEVTVTLSKTSISIGEGEEYKLTATTSDGSAVGWTSSDSAIAAVKDGLVTGVSKGSATVTASSGGSSASCRVTVTEKGSDVEVPEEVTENFTKTEKEDIYSYNSYYSVNPKTWNPHTWTDGYDSVILEYTTIGFYGVQLNASGDGYEWVCEMAAAFPSDVTENYVGHYGISAGESRKAWEIKLNPAACWEDGTAITADDYIYSMQQLLNPKMLNRRLDSYTSGDLSVYGAKNYVYSLTSATFETLSSLGYDDAQAAIADGQTVFLDAWTFWNAEGYTDKDGNLCPQYISISDTTVYDTPSAWTSGVSADAFSGKQIFETYYGKELTDDLLFIERDNENLDYGWEEGSNGGVGLLKTGTYKIVLILNSAVDDFTLKYKLSSTWLVNKDLYEKCKVTTGGLVSSTYGTSLNTYISYGPYKLSSFYNDNSYTMKTNEYWYGYSDGRHDGQFQTTSVNFTYLDPSTAKSTSLQLFMQGKLDDYSLDGSEMPAYGNSRYLYTTPESYTYQFFICTDYGKLHERDTSSANHSVLSLQSFRKALSYSIQRATYCTKYDPASEPGFGVLNYLYVIDPETGATYRDTEEAKRVVLEVNDFKETDSGWTSNNGNIYGDIDDAYEAVTGYDKALAAKLFEQAYAEAVAQGIYTAGTPVVIDRGSTGVSANGTAFLNDLNGWIADVLASCTGATFPSVTLVYNTRYNTSATYWAAVKGGDIDLAFSAWGGSAMSPWSTIYNCYIDKGNTLNYGFTEIAENLNLTIAADGGDITATLSDWAKWLANYQEDSDYQGINLSKKLGILAEADMDFKVKVLAECEKAQLLTYSNLPIFYSAQNALHSAKYNLGTESYLQLLEFGGVRHISYNYTDAEWAAWVSSQGGDLTGYYTAN